MSLSDFTESQLRRNSKYVKNSVRTEISQNLATVTYQISQYSTENAIIGTSSGAGAGAGSGAAIGLAVGGPIGALAGGLIGLFSGAGAGGGIASAIPEKITHTRYFDVGSGEFLGSNMQEAVSNALSKGISKFKNLNFSNAQKLFQVAYYHSPDQSYEEQVGESHRNVTDLLIEGINLINNGNYTEGREKITKAYNDVTNSEMKSVIGNKRNELAEKINSQALNYFQFGNWLTANDLFHHAYFICTDGYLNENEFKNRRDIAFKMMSIGSSDDVAGLTSVLKSTSNSTMRTVIQNRLNTAARASVINTLNEGVTLINNGSYETGRKKMQKAQEEATTSELTTIIHNKRNEMAEKINSRALDSFKSGNWETAEELFHHAYYTCTAGYSKEYEFRDRREIASKMKSADDVDALTSVLNSTSNSSMRTVIQNRLNTAKQNAARASVMRTLNEGITLINNGNYGAGREKILKAEREASTSEQETMIKNKRNELAEKINSRALNYFESENWETANELFYHAFLTCTNGYMNENEFKNRRDIASKMKSANDVAALTDVLNATKNSSMKNVIQNRLNIAQEKASRASVMSTLNEGIDLINNGSYEAGREKIQKAENEATTSELKIMIQNKRNDMAEKINSQALNNFESGNWTTAYDLFNYAYQTSTDVYTYKGEYKNRQEIASKMISIGSTDDVPGLTNVLNATTNSTMRNVIQTRLNTAKRNAAIKYFTDATTFWNQAWTAEKDEIRDGSDEADENFRKSQELFQKAAELAPENENYSKWSAVSSLKIEGNNDFNVGLKLQEEGNKLKSQSKYAEAKEKYTQAKNNFDEGFSRSGDQRFQTSIDFVSQQIDDVEKIILSITLGKIDVQEHENTNVNNNDHEEDKDIDTTVHH